MSVHLWVRLLLGLASVPMLAIATDAAYDRMEGHRFCLDHALAATSPDLTTMLCRTIGIDGGALPTRLRDVLAEAVDGALDEVWDPLSGETRRFWAALG